MNLKLIIFSLMKSSIIRDDKNRTLQNQYKDDDFRDEIEKDKKIKRLTQINKQLIDTLKQQNQELTKKINKQKLKIGGRSSSVKSTPSNTKQLESVKKQLSNAYKQIDMYKEIIQNLRAKEVPLDSFEKINQLQHKVKSEDQVIENYQKQLKYIASIREKQEKQLKVFENQETKNSVKTIEKQTAELKEKLKTLKKNSSKRQEIEKRQHAYYVQLERALRKANDQYYPGKIDKKDTKQVQENQITQRQWQTVKTKLFQLRKLYQENNKKIDLVNRQKIRQTKSFEENQLKLKQKMRKLNALKSRITQLGKLIVSKEPKKQTITLPVTVVEPINDKNKNTIKSTNDREIKKWNVPSGFFCLEKGKILPDSTFFSDKNILEAHHKYKIIEVNVWTNPSGIPCLLKFFYENESGQKVEGNSMMSSIPNSYEINVFKMKDKDYLSQIKGVFSHGLLNSIVFVSKFGKEIELKDENEEEEGDQFNFLSKPNQIPCCFFGATVKQNANDIRICHIGCEFIGDW